MLGSLLCLLYSAVIPAQNNTALITFADETAVLSLQENYNVATGWLQIAITEIINRATIRGGRLR